MNFEEFKKRYLVHAQRANLTVTDEELAKLFLATIVFSEQLEKDFRKVQRRQ